MKATTVKTISNTVHRHHSPPKKKPLEIKLPILKPKLIHIRKALIQKIIQQPPPLDLRSIERNHKSPKPNLTTELTPDLESKVIDPPDFRTKSGGHPSTPIHQRKLICMCGLLDVCLFILHPLSYILFCKIHRKCLDSLLFLFLNIKREKNNCWSFSSFSSAHR